MAVAQANLELANCYDFVFIKNSLREQPGEPSTPVASERGHAKPRHGHPSLHVRPAPAKIGSKGISGAWVPLS